jgi:hypothetical protein
MINALIVLIEEKTEAELEAERIGQERLAILEEERIQNEANGIHYNDGTWQINGRPTDTQFRFIDHINYDIGNCHIPKDKQKQSVAEIVSYKSVEEMKNSLLEIKPSNNMFFHYNDEFYICDIAFVNNKEYRNINFIFQIYKPADNTWVGANNLLENIKDNLKTSSIKLRTRQYMNLQNG